MQILAATDNALTKQYVALPGTEGVEVRFDETGVAAIARIAAEETGEPPTCGPL